MSNPGFPFSVGATIGVGPNSATVAISAGVAGQGSGGNFSTIPLPNTRLALYTLTINAPGNPGQIVLSYTFPLSPSSVTKEFDAKNSTYDVAGRSDQNGVQRIVDLYGNSPTTFQIRGTTGWQYHSTDGFALSGADSIAALKSALDQFAALNKAQIDNNNSQPYTMNFFDYFSQEFWQVVPVGRQSIEQDERRPLLFYYNFRLAGIMPLDAPPVPTEDDPILSAFTIAQPQAVATLATSTLLTLTNYAPNTAGAVDIGASVGISL